MKAAPDELLYVAGAASPAPGAPDGARIVTEEALRARLAAGWDGPVPALVLFDPGIAQPLALARGLRAAGIESHYAFLRWPDDLPGLRAQLQRAPLIGRHWSLLAAASADLDTVLAQVLQDARRRARLRTTLARANRQLAAPAAPDFRRMQLAEHYLDSYLAQASDAMIGLDPDLAIIYWNGSAARLFGVEPERALTLALPALPGWCDSLAQALEQLRDGADAAEVELECEVGGALRQLDVACSAVRDRERRLAGFMLAARDATLRHARLREERAARDAAARELDERRRELARLFDLAPGFMAVTRGPQHVFEMANRAYLDLFGERNFGERALADVFPELADQPFARLRDEVYASGRAYVARAMPVLLRASHGGPELRYLDFVYQPIAGPDGAIGGIFCQGHDVTEQKLMQDGLLHHQAELEQLVSTRTEALRKANLALHQSQKLEAVGKLTGGVAHDFNNILQVIGSNLELLGMELAPGARGRARVDGALAAVRRGGKLAAQLLAFARRQPLQPVPTDLTTSVRDMDDLLRRALGPTIDIELRIGPDLWPTLVDRDQLENVLLNLAINARDAMAGVGRLTIELENTTLDDLYLAANPDVVPGQYVLLAVSDNGSGMNEQVRERAFEPFFTTKAEGQGTGLGLSMAYGFVKQSGGHIKLYSEAGAGTTVKIFLPRTSEQAAPATRAHRDIVRGGNETVLVVEDDMGVQAAVVDILGGLGYTVLAASDAQSALPMLEAGRVDLLFSDVVMPGPMRSTELARRARALQPGIAVLFTSGYTRSAMMHGARLESDVELLSKPYRRADLARKVRQVLDARSAQ